MQLLQLELLWLNIQEGFNFMIMRQTLKYTIFSIILLFFFNSSCKQPELVFPLKANQVVKEYKKHKWRSNRWYKNKELEVEGTISQNYKNDKGEVIIILATLKAPFGVSCTIENPEKQIKKPLKQNQLITIKGICIGVDKHVELKKCTIIKR